MATDQVSVGGPSREGRGRRLWCWAAIAVGLVAFVALGAEIIARRDRAEQARRDAFWRVDGPPCAPLDPKVFRGLGRYPQVTPYDETLYRRAGGAMTCTHLVDEVGGAKVRYQVCKFDAPTYLAVAQGGREWFFDLGARSAAVTVVKDKARCVVIPPFKM